MYFNQVEFGQRIRELRKIQGKTQEELAAAYDDIVMVSRSFKTFAAKGLMKDRFHYLQPAYNEVGEEAGRSVAEYWAEK